MEERLWRICERLRGGVDVHDYKHVILPLVFLRCADLNFEKRLKEIESMKHFSGEILPEFFNENGGIFLSNDARWNYLVDCAKSSVKNLDARLDRAFRLIMEENLELDGIFENNFIKNLKIDAWRLEKIILEIDKLETKDLSSDSLSRAYMYLLQKFSAKETRGKNRGEFYTPKSVMDLIEEQIGGKISGKIYDPCIGMGGMVLPLALSSKENLEIFGEEINPETYKFAKLNLFMHGFKPNLVLGDTLENDAYKTLKADFVFCNPPFNLKTKNHKNANYAWLNLCVEKLMPAGRAFVILPGTALADENFLEERKKLIEKNLVAVINLPIDTFSGVETPISVWVLENNRQKKSKSITFIDKRGPEKRVEVPCEAILSSKNLSLAPSDWILNDSALNSKKIDFTSEIEQKIKEKELEIKNLKNMLEQSLDYKLLKSRKLRELIEEVKSEKTLEKNEFAVNLIHVGRDKKLPLILNETNESLEVPKSYYKFRLKKEIEKSVSPEYFKLLLSRPEIAKNLAYKTDKTAWGKVGIDDFLDAILVS